MADTTTSELLAILSKVQPLLLPDLPSPPPSPNPNHGSKALENGINGKRKLENHQESDSKRSRNGTLPPRPPGPPPPPPSIDLKPPTPEFRQSRLAPPPPPPAAPSSVSMKTSLRMNSNTSLNGTGGGGEPEWRKDWSKERLRKLGAQCRDQGRRLKHSGDSLARRSSSSSSTQTILLSLAHQLDAILLYVFAFWCDDTASKTCLPGNWSSVFGLIGFVKKTAEKENQTLLIGICLRMEAIAIYTLSMHEQKALFYKATQLSSSSSQHSSSSSYKSVLPSAAPPSRPPPPPPPPAPATANGNGNGGDQQPSPASSSSNSMNALSPSHPSPSTSAPLPPGPPPPPPPPPPAVPSTSASNSNQPPVPPPSDSSSKTTSNSNSNLQEKEFLKQFLKASPDLFRFQKLYDESCSLLLLTPTSTSNIMVSYESSELVLPNPIITTTTNSSEGISIEEGELSNGKGKGEVIVLPIELARGTGSPISTLMIPSQVGYCRELLKNWIENLGLDYQFVKIG
ncbi:hypothetical protein JCM3765_000911 [Sporobolomyces pararoseus]